MVVEAARAEAGQADRGEVAAEAKTSAPTEAMDQAKASLAAAVESLKPDASPAP